MLTVADVDKETRWDRADAWKRRLDLVARQDELAASVVAGLEHYARIKTIETRFGEEVRGGTPFNMEVAKAIESAYREWLEPCRELINELVFMKEHGHPVTRARELVDAYHSCPVNGFSLDSMERALENIKEGKVLSNQEAFNVLRDKMGARSVGQTNGKRAT